jgi:hypothetical protein
VESATTAPKAATIGRGQATLTTGRSPGGEKQLADDREQHAEPEQREHLRDAAGANHLDDGLHREEPEQHRAGQCYAQTHADSSGVCQHAAESPDGGPERDQADTAEAVNSMSTSLDGKPNTSSPAWPAK